MLWIPLINISGCLFLPSRGSQDHLVCLHPLAILKDKSHMRKVLLTQVTKMYISGHSWEQSAQEDVWSHWIQFCRGFWQLWLTLFWAGLLFLALIWALFWVAHYFERFTLLSVPSLEHFFEWPTHLSPLLSKATHLSPFLSKSTRLSTFLSTQKSRFALESTFLSVFALLSTFLSAQKSAQGPAQPTSPGLSLGIDFVILLKMYRNICPLIYLIRQLKIWRFEGPLVTSEFEDQPQGILPLDI